MRKLAAATLAAMATMGLAETAAGIKWTAPVAWKPEGQRPMRAATYQVPAAPGDKENGECAVFYFGPGQGGTVEANWKRWVAQFEQPDGKPSEKVARVARHSQNSLDVTTVDVTGSYTGAGGPMAASKVSKPGYRLMGAIVEAPQGLVFFKFTGPAKTVVAQQSAFQKMIASISR